MESMYSFCFCQHHHISHELNQQTQGRLWEEVPCHLVQFLSGDIAHELSQQTQGRQWEEVPCHLVQFLSGVS